MANASAPFPIQPTLQSAFESADRDGTRWIAVKIVNETFSLAGKGQQTASMANDFNAQAAIVNNDDPLYFLFKLDSKNWLVVSYVPPNTKVKDKMLNASAKSQLQRQLGYQFFTEELHTNTKEELSWDFYKGTTKPEKPYSSHELEHQRIIAEEDAERQERAKLASSSGGGGSHSIALPLSAEASAKVSQLNSGSINFLELVVNPAKNGINSGAAETVAEHDLTKRIHTREPRYYVYKAPPSKTIFIFSCPDNAPPQLKMVYSSAKGTVAQSLRIQFTKQIEIREPGDLTVDALRGTASGVGGLKSSAGVGGLHSSGGAGTLHSSGSSQPAKGPSGGLHNSGGILRTSAGSASPGAVGRAAGSWEGSTTPAAKQVTGQRVDTNTPHPIYSLITKGSPTSSPEPQRNPNRKTVIIPPKSAW